MAQVVRTSQLIDDVATRTGLSKAQAQQAVAAVVAALGERGPHPD